MKSTDGVTSNKFSTKNLTSTSGRLDIIFRCLLAAFSFDYTNIIFHTVLNGPPNPPKALKFVGNQIDPLPIDEIGMAQLFQMILDPNNSKQLEGVYLTNSAFLQVAQELAQEGPLILLQEKTLPLQDYFNELKNKVINLDSIIFILGDSLDLKNDELEFLVKELNAIPVTLGSQSYLASHCIVFVLMELEKLKLK
ncbi:MAG TPA: hypothetical protein VMV49_04590 [Candidatus Deferrimicrobium sp.]|nr:hypothetical protein [Candidatus Deferrimicrobium sp.]